jgi:hypothetical protein
MRIRQILFLAVLGVLAQLMGACNADMRGNPINTDITFTIEAFHQVTLDPVVPLIDVVASIPGYQPWALARSAPAPHRFTIHSSEFSQAANQVVINAQLAEPNPDVVLRCTWFAQTPSGVRLSRDSAGGEGESYAGAPVRCEYKA